MRRRTGLLAVTALVLTAAACGSSGKGGSPTTTTSGATTTTQPSATSVPATTSPVTTGPRVSSRATVYLVAGEHVVAAGRVLPAAATPAAAVRALLAGPQGEIERSLGYGSAIPSGTTLNAVTVSGNVATVDLSARFASGGGSLSMMERVAQVVFTVTAFPGVERVRFRLDGTPAPTIGGEGLMVDNVGRDAFTDVTPLILVEAPTPGQVVKSPMRVRGTSNTFEATVNYTLTGPDGKTLTEGHTTATAGTGTWGTFDFQVSFTSGGSGAGRLRVYEISPKDGSHIHEMSIPVQLS